MQIARLIARHVRIPLKHQIRHASHVRDANDTLIVCCELASGATGWGEGLPRPYVTGETIDSAWEQLKATDWGQLDRHWRSLGDALETLDNFRLAGVLSPDERGCLGNSVRCAVELSVLDALCRELRVPLSHVTDLVPEARPLRRSAAYVQYSGIVTAMTPWRQIRAAFRQRLYGFRHCKVKVGVRGQDDASTLARVRRILGPHVDLRVDANEAWSCEELLDKGRILSRFGITAVEQPVAHAAIAKLAEVRRQMSVPVMLDESICSQIDARYAIEHELSDLFNIRLSKCGGFVNSLRLAAMARAGGLGFQFGCQVGETGILSAAGRHFATSVGGLRYVEGSYDRHLVAETLVREETTFGYGGRAPALHAPGLGVTVDADALARVTVRRQTVWER